VTSSIHACARCGVPAGSDGLPLDVGRLPSCLLGKLAQISTTSQRRPANIDTKWLDGTHTPHIMRMNGGCRAYRWRSGSSGAWMGGWVDQRTGWQKNEHSINIPMSFFWYCSLVPCPKTLPTLLCCVSGSLQAALPCRTIQKSSL
jgi:hypothetical protein